jgi:hypothetical protein
MNDEDLRDLFAGMALMGLTSRGVMDNSEPRVAKWCYVLADAMIEAKYTDDVPEVGIAAVKKRKTKEQ